jgi:hypothetical protein
MMTPAEQQQHLLLLSTLIQLEKRIRQTQTLAEFAFAAVNETLRLIRYRQAVLWEMKLTGKPGIQAVSGVDKPEKNAPFIVYLHDLIEKTLSTSDSRKILSLKKEDIDKRFQDGWQEWGIGVLLWCPLISPAGEIQGGLLFIRPEPWNEAEIALTERLCEAYAYTWDALRQRKQPWYSQLGKGKKTLKLWGLFFFVLFMILPIRLSVLAPVEIVPHNDIIVSSPIDGVIRRFFISPNDAVKKGQALFRMDDTTIRNEYEVSKKSLAVAQTEHLRAVNKAFADDKSRESVMLLEAQIREKTAEVNYMAELLERCEVRAETDGIAVFGDVNDWLGKPVVVGEKLMSIANPKSIEAEIRLPVADAINLEDGAEVLVFLNVEPDRPLSAKLRRAAYEAQLTPEGILAFRLKASLISKDRLPRIGLRGTAKIYGKQVLMFYYLLRRPLATFRQYLGW